MGRGKRKPAKNIVWTLRLTRTADGNSTRDRMVITTHAGRQNRSRRLLIWNNIAARGLNITPRDRTRASRYLCHNQ